MSPLYQEINSWLSTPFDWATANCAFVAADWVLRVRGVDPAARWRWTFDDAGSCQRATGFFSDPVSVVDAALAEVHIQRGNDLRAGDVGVLMLWGVARPVVGIWTGIAWAMKGPDGATTRAPATVEVLAFWDVGYDA